MCVQIARMGIISPIGRHIGETRQSIRTGKRGISPLKLFSCSHSPPLPAGEVTDLANDTESLPRTHRLALAAASEATDGFRIVPEAIVLGVTTGGMPKTEGLLRKGVKDPERYARHSLSSVG